MKKYNVNVNGTMYEITLEVVDSADVPAPAAAPATAAAPVEAAPAPAAPVANAEGEQVNSPMPGNILAVNVNVGDTVKAGQVLMILEAMKMENEIMAGVDGKIVSLNVQKGSTVETGTLLCVIG
ncbi:MAG: biotin/lipoyl-containing protein [Acutalibacteraceae bacterium]|nr:biotin/lipoyl-containing protein [Acutalibacteraceae bacterium]